MGGLAPLVAPVFWPFLAGALCLAGVPPTGGFFSKDSILSSGLGKGRDVLWNTLSGGTAHSLSDRHLYLQDGVYGLWGSYAFRHAKNTGGMLPCNRCRGIMKNTLIPLACWVLLADCSIFQPIWQMVFWIPSWPL